MAEDLKWELALLATVQAFYQRLLSEQLGALLPAPAELAPDVISRAEDVPPTLKRMHVWIHLLDMAITPAMLRLEMTPDLDPEAAEALLRYFVRHRDDSSTNRDKTDLVATFLFRHPRVPGQWERHGYGLDGSIPLSPFEIALLEILSESDVPALPEEHTQLLREFGPLLEQANRFQDFSALIDSGIISRVRELKASLGESIYHPGVLATLASYNAAFGERFQTLFAAATHELKDFARQLEALGGSILSTIDGVEVTAELVASMDEKSLLQFDYAPALEKFRRISRLKKELQRRPPIRPSQSSSATVVSSAHAVGSGGAGAAPARETVYAPAAITPQALSVEEAKLRRVEESIRVFVRVADPKFRQIVPMRYFNLMLSPAEIDACTADHLEQTSLRAEGARTILRVAALTARMTTEMEGLKRAPRSNTMWKLHADSLAILLDLAKRTPDAAKGLASASNADGSHAEQEMSAQVHASVEKMKERAAQASKLLAEE